MLRGNQLFFFFCVQMMLLLHQELKLEQGLQLFFFFDAAKVKGQRSVFFGADYRYYTAWCCEIGSLWSLDAPELHVSMASENQSHCARL